MKNSFLLMGFVGIYSLLMSSCQKEITNTIVSSEVPAGLIVRMTDAATSSYNKVNIDLQGVEITSVLAGPAKLNPNAGVYNLLDYSNGRDTIIGAGAVKSGYISQVRLILGSKNTIVVNGITYPLLVMADDPGLKVSLQNSLETGMSYTLLLDFDAAQSVVVSNGVYSLKAVVHVVDPSFDDRPVPGPR